MPRGAALEYHVEWPDIAPPLQRIETAILDADPSASIDVDAANHRLRVAGSLATVELIALLHQAGYPVTAAQVVALPSFCCGDCAG
ncbi:MAG: hypothetical protein ABI300_00455 [Rhodanobacter sp.]